MTPSIHPQGIKIIARVLADIFDLPPEADAGIQAVLETSPHTGFIPTFFIDAQGKTHGEEGACVLVNLPEAASQSPAVAHLLASNMLPLDLQNQPAFYEAQAALAAHLDSSPWRVDGEVITAEEIRACEGSLPA